MPSDRPNVLVICTDQQFAGMMSCAGTDEIDTPAMDSLAESGVRFTDAYCTDPVCNPSRASMFTGRMPHEIGVAEPNREESKTVGIDPDFREEELGRLFQDAGYDCGYAGKWHVPELAMPEDNDHGFERVCHFDDWGIPGACADFVERDREDPFLLVASFDNPHNICEWARNEKLPWGDVEPIPPEECPSLPANFQPPPYEPDTASSRRSDKDLEYWRQYQHAYYTLIERVDDQVGEILDALQGAGVADDTVVVFTSDHGDHHGAHQLTQKHLLYEESAHVPFIVDGLADRGTTDDRLVSNGLDLLPTLCDYAGIDPPADLLGGSLYPVVEGSGDAERRDQLVVQSSMMQGRMVRTEGYKYVVYEKGQNREQLFDMETDRGEMVDLSVNARYGDVLDDHRERLLDWCLDTKDPYDTHYGQGYGRGKTIPGIPGYDYGEVEAIMDERGISFD